MTPTIKLIDIALKKIFNTAEIQVTDDREEHIGHAHEDSGHFTVSIKSPVFRGKNAIQKHRMIYDALGSLMQTHIHALKIKVSEE